MGISVFSGGMGLELSQKIDRLMSRVQKPSRYLGCEFGSEKKDPKSVDVRYAFLFPDVYEVAMSHLGMKILYHTLNRRVDTYCERVWFAVAGYGKR